MVLLRWSAVESKVSVEVVEKRLAELALTPSPID